MKVMFDTNIWIDFLLYFWKKEKGGAIPKGLKKSVEIYDKITLDEIKGKTTIVLSDWNTFELRDQISKLILEKKFIQEGYSLSEFGEARKEITLENEDNTAISDILMSFWLISDKGCNHNLDHIFLQELSELNISTFDAIHIFQAQEEGCDYFVTRDNALRKHLRENKQNINLGKLKVINRKTFLAKLKSL